jgi:hypothetical protein
VVRRAFAAGLLVPLLAGCSTPVFVPEAGPGAPDYRRQAAPTAPSVKIVPDADVTALPAAGSVDETSRADGTFEVTGWAVVDPTTPRGVLRVVLPREVDATVETITTQARPDVVTATGNDQLLWSGFTIRLRGEFPEGNGVCVLSRSTQGSFRLNGSDEELCPLRDE